MNEIEIIIKGKVGIGKSTIGRLIYNELCNYNIPCDIDTDETITKYVDVSVLDPCLKCVIKEEIS